MTTATQEHLERMAAAQAERETTIAQINAMLAQLSATLAQVNTAVTR